MESIVQGGLRDGDEGIDGLIKLGLSSEPQCLNRQRHILLSPVLTSTQASQFGTIS